MPDKATTKLNSETALGSILARGAAGDFIVKATGIGLILVTQAILARIMGPDEFGNYTYVMAWVLVLALIARLGLDNTLLRFVAAYYAEHDYASLKGIIGWSTRIILASGIIIGITFALVSALATISLSEDQSTLYLLAIPLIPLVALAQLRLFSLRALHHVFIGQAPELILNPMVVATGAYIIFYSTSQITSAHVMMLTLVATLLSVWLGSRLLSIHLPAAVKQALPETHKGKWMKVAFPLLLVSGTNIIIMQSDVLMLGALTNTTNAGIYSVASRIAMLVSFGLIAVNALAAPLISKYHTLNNKIMLARIARHSAITGFFTVLPAMIIVIVFGENILNIFGLAFSNGYTALVILSLGQLVNVLCGSVGILLTMTGNELIAARYLSICAVVNLSLNAALIPHYGLHGAAIATAVATALWNILLLAQVVRLLGINPTIFQARSSKKSNI